MFILYFSILLITGRFTLLMQYQVVPIDKHSVLDDYTYLTNPQDVKASPLGWHDMGDGQSKDTTYAISLSDPRNDCSRLLEETMLSLSLTRSQTPPHNRAMAWRSSTPTTPPRSLKPARTRTPPGSMHSMSSIKSTISPIDTVLRRKLSTSK